jgi:hypothetical protein
LGLIVQRAGLNVLFAHDLEILLDRQLALSEALASLSCRHFERFTAMDLGGVDALFGGGFVVRGGSWRCVVALAALAESENSGGALRPAQARDGELGFGATRSRKPKIFERWVLSRWKNHFMTFF